MCARPAVTNILLVAVQASRAARVPAIPTAADRDVTTAEHAVAIFEAVPAIAKTSHCRSAVIVGAARIDQVTNTHWQILNHFNVIIIIFNCKEL